MALSNTHSPSPNTSHADLEAQLTAALLQSYTDAGKQTGYWAHRFLRAVRNKGGLATARSMLKPRTTQQRAGLDRLIAAGKPELTMEAIILKSFRPLFTEAELKIAEERLGVQQGSSERNGPVYHPALQATPSELP